MKKRPDYEAFDWDEAEAVLIQPAQAIAVYLNPAGDLVIRQEKDEFDPIDIWIVIPRLAVPMFLAHCEKLVATP